LSAYISFTPSAPTHFTTSFYLISFAEHYKSVVGVSGVQEHDSAMMRVSGAVAQVKDSQHKRRGKWTLQDYFEYLVAMEKDGWPENCEHKSFLEIDKLLWEKLAFGLAEAGQSLSDKAAAFALFRELMELLLQSQSKAKKGE
jgi:hypothetical protein